MDLNIFPGPTQALSFFHPEARRPAGQGRHKAAGARRPCPCPRPRAAGETGRPCGMDWGSRHGTGTAARPGTWKSASGRRRSPGAAHAASARPAERRDGAPRNRSVGGAGDTLPCNRSLLPGFSFNFAGWLWPFPKFF